MSCVNHFGDDGWLTDTHLKLSVLLGKSMEATISLNEAFQAFQKAREASAKFCNNYLHSESTMQKSISQNIVRGENIFIAVKTSLYSDGSFWCRVWKHKTAFDEDIIDNTSKELGWMEKDMTAKKVLPTTLNTPMFYFSQSRQSYLRVVVEKCFEDRVVARLLDIGTSEEVSLNTHFYLLPQSNVKKFPFLCIQGRMCKEETELSYEIKWRFKDLTHDQIMLAHVTDVIERKQFPSYQLEIKSLLTDMNISSEILANWNKNEEDKMKKDEPLIHPCEKQEELVFQKPLPIVATVEPVKQNIPKKTDQDQEQRPQSSRTSRSRNNSQSRSRNNSLSRRDCSREKPQNKSSSRENKSDATSNGNRKIPSRYNSVERLTNLKTTKAISKSTEAVMTQKESPKTDSKETTFDIETAMNKLATKSEVKDKELTRDLGNWMDSISLEERRKVPRCLPPLMNLFYNSTTLRQEPWWGIELLNINALLSSQARMLFYFYKVTKTRVLNSFKNGFLEFPADNVFQRILENAPLHTQYFVLRNFQCTKYTKVDPYIYGIARLDSSTPNEVGHYPVSYLSLSRCTAPVPEWEFVQGRATVLMNINKAKDIVNWFSKTLGSQHRVPMFPEYFPWCGVPPCMENIKKPASKRQLNSKHDSRSTTTTSPAAQKSTINSQTTNLTSPPVQSETTKQAEEPLKSPPVQVVSPEIEEEIWDISDDDQKSPLRRNGESTDTCEKKSEECKSTMGDCASTTEETTKPAIRNEERVDFLSESTTGREQIIIRDDSTSPSQGYYDQTGMWYPTIVANVVDQAIGDFVRIDYNQNCEPAPIQILKRPKSGLVEEDLKKVVKEPADSEEKNSADSNERVVNGHHSPLPPQTTPISEPDTLDCVESSGKCRIPLPPPDLLSLVSVTSDHSGDDDLENEERFERDCQIFGVSSTDFD